MNRRFRMISLMAEALSIEMEETREIDKMYEKQFLNDFAEVQSYLMEQMDLKEAIRENRKKSEDLADIKGPKESLDVLKTLYRDLARKTHPDVSGVKDDEEFKELQKAYGDHDLEYLFSAANKHKIDVEVTQDEMIRLKAIIDEKRKEIENIKKTVRWAWGVSDRNPSIRKNIIKSMGADPTKFEEWRNSKNHNTENDKD